MEAWYQTFGNAKDMEQKDAVVGKVWNYEYHQVEWPGGPRPV
jgi:hypothetical protein